MTAPEPTGITDRTVELWATGQQQQQPRMRRYLIWYTCTGDHEQDIYAPDEKRAEEIAWAWLEKTYPDDPALSITDIDDITSPHDFDQPETTP